MLLLFLLMSVVGAHMPVFDDTLEGSDVTDKSWGVYIELEKDESYSVFLDVKKDHNISFSINLAGSQDHLFDFDTYIKTTLLGHNASQIECDPKFSGWGYSDSRRLSGTHPGSDETKVIDYKPEDLHFEPFGVGYYRPLATCQGKVPVEDDNFTLTVTVLKTFPEQDSLRLSIGVGMAEQFSFLEIILFPITLSNVWFWDGYLFEFFFTHLVGLFVILTIAYEKRKEIEDWPKYFTLALLAHNIWIYSIRFATTAYRTDTNNADNIPTILLSVGIHIGMPLIFFLLVFCAKIEKRKTFLFYTAHILFSAYCLFFVIQTFWFTFIASVALMLTRK